VVRKEIADLDLDTDRGIPLDPGLLTKDAMEIINDPQIDIVVELIGGCVRLRTTSCCPWREGNTWSQQTRLSSQNTEKRSTALQRGMGSVLRLRQASAAASRSSGPEGGAFRKPDQDDHGNPERDVQLHPHTYVPERAAL